MSVKNYLSSIICEKTACCIPQVEIFGELQTSINVLFHFTVDAWNELRERKSFRKRFLQW